MINVIRDPEEWEVAGVQGRSQVLCEASGRKSGSGSGRVYGVFGDNQIVDAESNPGLEDNETDEACAGTLASTEDQAPTGGF